MVARCVESFLYYETSLLGTAHRIVTIVTCNGIHVD